MGAEVIVVVGAAGGAGASTLAALLARRRAGRGGGRGRDAEHGRVALVDLDPTGGGLEVLLGCEDRPGVRWSALHDVRGTVAASDMIGVLPRWEGVEVLSGDRAGGAPRGEALTAVWQALCAGCTAVVADLPASVLVDSGSSLSGSVRSDSSWSGSVLSGSVPGRAEVLVLTGQDVLGVAAGLRSREEAVAVARDLDGTARLVLRRRPRARVAALDAARTLDLPLAGTVPADRTIAVATDRGLGPLVRPGGRLGAAVARLDRALGGDGR